MHDNAFQRELRLLTPSQFQNVFSDPIRVSSSHLILLAKLNDLAHARLGFAIAKKRVKLACNRNQIKRVIRDSFRLNRHDMLSIDIVVIGKNGVEQLSSAQLHTQVRHLWTRLNSRCAKLLS